MSDSKNSNNFDCNISENECKKSKKYKRDDINDIAEACNIKDFIKVKSRAILCDLIIAKREGKNPTPPDSPKRAKAPKKGKECNKQTLENCTVLQLKKICSDEGIEKCAKNKDDLIKHILQSRKNKKGEDEEEEEDEEPSVKKITKQVVLKLLRSLGTYSDIADKYPLTGDLKKKLKELLEKNNYTINDDNKDDVKKWRKECLDILYKEESEETDEDEEPMKPPTPKKKKDSKKKKAGDCDEENLENCKIADLIDICKKNGITGYSKYKAEGKSSLTEFIKKQLKTSKQEEEEEEEEEEEIPTPSVKPKTKKSTQPPIPPREKTPPIPPRKQVPPPIPPRKQVPPPIPPRKQVPPPIPPRKQVPPPIPPRKQVQPPPPIPQRKKQFPPPPIIIPEPILSKNINTIDNLLLSQAEKPFTFETETVAETISEPETIENIFKRDEDIDVLLSDLQIPSQCNPLNNEYCDDNYHCDIDTKTCISKDIDIPLNYSTIEINGHSIIGTFDTIEKLNQELRSINLPFEESEYIPIFEPSFAEPDEPSFAEPPSIIKQKDIDIIEDIDYVEPPISTIYKINDIVLIKEGKYKNLYGRINYIDDLNGELGIIPIGEDNIDNLEKYYYFREEISEPLKDYMIEEEEEVEEVEKVEEEEEVEEVEEVEKVEDEEEVEQEEEEEEKPLPKKVTREKKKFTEDLLNQIQDIPDDELENIDIANNTTLKCLGLLG